MQIRTVGKSIFGEEISRCGDAKEKPSDSGFLWAFSSPLVRNSAKALFAPRKYAVKWALTGSSIPAASTIFN